MPPQLTRLVLIFAVLIAAFIGVRWVATPDSFYDYGHYRGKALSESAAQANKYVPKVTCSDCHDEEAKQNAAGPHAKLNCQTCHGTGSAHVEEPSTDNIIRPDAKDICLRCHEENAARPARFPQINPADHGDGERCNTCHLVHNPLEMK